MTDRKKAAKRPLLDLQVLITRAEHQAKDLSDRLADLGAKPVELAVIEIGPPDCWDALDSAIRQLSHYDWVILASTNALRGYLQRLNLQAIPMRDEASSAASAKVAVIGKSTEQAAQASGLRVDFCPDRYIAEGFIEQFPGYPNLGGMRFLWPRANIGRNLIREKLIEAGATVDIVAAYKSSLPADVDALSMRLHELIAGKQVNVITLASAQTTANLAAIICQKWVAEGSLQANSGANVPQSATLRDRIKHLLQNITVVSIGPETSEAARNHLGKVDLEANPHDSQGMISALLNEFAIEKN